MDKNEFIKEARIIREFGSFVESELGTLSYRKNFEI